MRVTVVHTTASTTDIAGYEALPPLVAVPQTRGVRSAGRLYRSRRRGPAAQPVLVIGDTAMVTVVRPSRHSVGGGPRARPAAVPG